MATLSKITPLPQSEILHGGKITLGTVGIPDCKIIFEGKKLPLASEALSLLQEKIRKTLCIEDSAVLSGKATVALEISDEVIPEIKKMEIGFDFSQTPMSYDMMLYTEFENKEDLDVYAVDKDHGKVKVIVAATTEARVVLDYEV